ncbi:hypothetical protein FJZ53_04285 [Candidatus Woesearchaeota archaeon]|nr:hypothetical protein [Candidatus Woesearchaeota archaeon]
MELKPKADYLFECSWEVCNKVGGIYTVIVSKARLMKKYYKNYFLVGPYFEEQARFDCEQMPPPQEFKEAFQALEKEGIKCHFGEWNIKGKPKLILIDFKGIIERKNEFKTKYWEDFKIDSLSSEWSFEEPLVWATAVGMMLEKIRPALGQQKVMAHFHEWLAGFSILYLKSKKIDIKTAFTTHATMLGRALAGNNRDFYSELKTLKPEEEAYRFNVQDKYLTEKACIFNADMATTVSEITGLEIEYLIGKKPDMLLLEGLDSMDFPTHEEAAIMHKDNKRRVYEFIKYFFFPYYHFDLENTLIFFTAARYEFRNKGFDIFIKSLGKLNEHLKKSGSRKTVLAFFFVPRETYGIKMELSENKVTFHQIKELVEENAEKIEETLMYDIIVSPDIEHSHGELFNKTSLGKIERLKYKFKRQTRPMLTTHNLPDEQNDAILKTCAENGLLNREEDRVKIVDYPIYLTGVDGLLDMGYYDIITASHLGVFPSYYEPWGYTPLETASLSVPALTTDLAGFGKFVLSKNIKDGVFVLKRFNRPEQEVIESFTKMMMDFCNLSKQQRVQQKINAKIVSQLADWREFVTLYIEAHNKAFEKQ